MAEITMPSTPYPRSMVWRFIQKSQVNTSQWTGSRQVLDLGRGWWECDIELPPILGTDASAWRGFVSAVEGTVNTFRVKPVPLGNQLDVAGGTISSVGATTGGSTSISVDGAAASVTIPAGYWVSANDQLFRLTQDFVADGAGTGTMSVQPPVRGTMPDNTVFEYDDPTMLCYVSDQINENNQMGDVMTIGFSVREAF